MIHINVVCDIVGCALSQPFWFEADGETFGDLIKAIQAQGWIVGNANPDPTKVDVLDQKHLRCYCPKHKAQPMA